MFGKQTSTQNDVTISSSGFGRNDNEWNAHFIYPPWLIHDSVLRRLA